MEDIGYPHPRGLNRAMMAALFTCDWIRAQQVVLIIGPTGAGKTYIAGALGNTACRHGISARYYRLARLVSELALARADGSFPKLLTQLAKIQLLILDDWGITPLGGQEARNLLEVMALIIGGISFDCKWKDKVFGHYSLFLFAGRPTNLSIGGPVHQLE